MQEAVIVEDELRGATKTFGTSLTTPPMKILISSYAKKTQLWSNLP
jgi:hypothetical protein